MKVFLKTWREAASLLNRRPKIMIPFLVVGLLNLIALYLLYFFPQRPLAYSLGPPVRAFFGEKFLHYPLNFFILPKLFNFAKIAINAFVGMLMTATAVGMIADTRRGERALFFLNGLRSIKRYVALIVTWGVIFAIMSLLGKLFVKLPSPASGLGSLFMTGLYFILVMLVNISFIYVIPVLIIGGKSIILAFKRNFQIIKRLYFHTAVLVILPSLLYFPILVAKNSTASLIKAFFPEVIVIVLVAGVVIMTLVEMLITTSITLVYLNQGDK